MQLPGYVKFCMDQLERAGFATYAVGGCVRDALLGLTPHDYDLCTAATPTETAAVFADFPLIRNGEKHGTIGVIFEKEVCEITTFRTEGNYADNRHPDWVEFVTDMEQDLARRDFTINAMAYSPKTGYCDPFGGESDLKNHCLRAVGDPQQRFTEDALRILRGVRFAVRFGLTPDADTEKAMIGLAHRLKSIAAERIFDELCKLLPQISAPDLLRYAPILVAVIPELAPCMGFDQHSRHHAFDVFTHTAYVVEGVPPVLPLRWAALLHDVGKPTTFTLDESGQGHFYGHAETSAQMTDAILRRLKAPSNLREQVVALVKLHMAQIDPEKKSVRPWMNRLQGFDLDIEHLLSLQSADMGSKGTGQPDDAPKFHEICKLIEEIRCENACISLRDLAVNGHDLLKLGYTGPKIGQALQYLLNQVLDENVPNEKSALLALLQR